jgi:hypothetical protein
MLRVTIVQLSAFLSFELCSGTTQEDEPQGKHQVFEPLPKSISNNEKERPLEWKPSLNEL